MGAPASAGQIQVMPTRLAVSAAAPTTTLFVTNADAGDAAYQVTVFDWHQAADGSDRLTPTRDLLANPGIFTLKPGVQQIVRFGLRGAGGEAAAERSFRVVLQELPRPEQQASGIRTLLRVSLPVFVPAAAATRSVRWALKPAKDGAVLVARNDGAVHVQVTGVAVEGSGAQAAIHCSTYLLPGTARTIPVAAPRPLTAGASYHLKIDTDGGPVTLDLRADPAAAAG